MIYLNKRINKMKNLFNKQGYDLRSNEIFEKF